MSWEKVQLKSLVSKGGVFIDGDWIESKDQDQNGEIRLIQLADIGVGKFIDKSSRFMTKDRASNLKCTYLKKGDILIARMPDPIGRCCIFPFEEHEKYVTVVDIAILRPNNETVSTRFLQHYINSNDFQSKIAPNITGTTRRRISRGKLENLEIPLPPLLIQEKIAAILDKADELRRKDQELLKKYDELAQAIFIDMFGDPVRNEKGWELKQLKEICKVKGGKRVPKGEKLVKEDTGFPYIKAGDIKNDYIRPIKTEYLLPQTQKKIARYIVNAGDVVITVVGVNIGDIGIVPEELDNANLTENANKFIIEDSSKLNNKFLAYFLQSSYIQSQIKKKIMAVGVPKLALFRIEELLISVPPIEIQNEFVNKIELINQLKAQTNAEKSDELFQSLLQRAFKGELVR